MNQNCYVTVWEQKDNVYITCCDDTVEQLIQSNRQRESIWKGQVGQFNDVPLPTWTKINNYVSHRKSKEPLTRDEISDFLGELKE